MNKESTGRWITRGPRLHDERPRKGRFAVDYDFEDILSRANQVLRPLEKELTETACTPEHPMVIICYPPRCGSTLLSQLLVQTRAFNYVTNFQARFWDAPFVAGLIEKKLGMRRVPLPHELKSEYGVTNAQNEPHEFGFFWNKWLVFSGTTHRVDMALMPELKSEALKRQVHALMSLYDQPFFIKSELVGLNVEYFSRLFENVIFLVIQRDLLSVAQSIYHARVQLYNDPKAYWSTRPSNEAHLQDLAPEEQIAMQIKGIYNDIYNGLRLTHARYVEVQYEDLCLHPKDELAAVMNAIGEVPNGLKYLPEQLHIETRKKVPRAVTQKLVRALSAVQ